jgi:hypothetical protein
MDLPQLVAVFASAEFNQNILEQSVSRLVKVAAHFCLCISITARTINDRKWK